MRNLMKMAGVILVLGLVAGSAAWAQAKPYVDAYSSASETKATLTGDVFHAVAKALQTGSSDLANAAKAKSTDMWRQRALSATSCRRILTEASESRPSLSGHTRQKAGLTVSPYSSPTGKTP